MKVLKFKIVNEYYKSFKATIQASHILKYPHYFIEYI